MIMYTHYYRTNDKNKTSFAVTSIKLNFFTYMVGNTKCHYGEKGELANPQCRAGCRDVIERSK